MEAARVIGATFWPITCWNSFSHLETHNADDYVERTSPIVGTAIAFWVCVAALIIISLTLSTNITSVGGEAVEGVRVVRATPIATQVLWIFLPLLYVAGAWMFVAREDRFPKG